jgi:hypothetical protein
VDYAAIHRFSKNHREAILSSKECGCFYCLRVFPPSEIDEWTDGDDSGIGQTAICPKCGIDSVLGSHDIPELSFEILKEMNDEWFEKTYSIDQVEMAIEDGKMMNIPGASVSWLFLRLLRIAQSHGGDAIRQPNGWINVRIPNRGEFTVAGDDNGDDAILFFAGWHGHFAGWPSIERFIEELLAGRCRVRVVYFGDLPFKWSLEYLHEGRWRRVSTSVALFVKFWRKRRTVYSSMGEVHN